MEEEIWVTVDFKPSYEVSNFGRIRNKNRNGFLKPWKINNSKGHLCVSLGRKNKYLVHRLVGYCFLGLDINNPNELICHKDDIAKHNFTWNLYVGDKSSNQLDFIRLMNERGEKHFNCKEK